MTPAQLAKLKELAEKLLGGTPMTPQELVETYDADDIAKMLAKVNALRLKDAEAILAVLAEVERVRAETIEKCAGLFIREENESWDWIVDRIRALLSPPPVSP